MEFTIHYYDLDDCRDTTESFADWQDARTRYNTLRNLLITGERIMELEFRGMMPSEYQ
jgi:hypothetical protein